MEQFNAENHLEYSFDFIIHKCPQAAAAQTMLCNQHICVKFWRFERCHWLTMPAPRLLTIVLSHFSFHVNLTSAVLWCHYKASPHVLCEGNPATLISKSCSFELTFWRYFLLYHVLAPQSHRNSKHFYKTAT